MGSIEVEVPRGAFIFGRDSAATFLGAKSSSTWKRMQKLKNMGNLTIQSNRQYSTITITNWDAYQGNGEEKEQPKELPGDNRGTTEEQPGDTYKKDKKVKECKEEPPPPPLGGVSDDPDNAPPKKKDPPKKKTTPCPVQKIVEIYHERCPTLPPVTSVTSAMHSRISARWAEDKTRQVRPWWEAYFSSVNESDFLTGRKTDWKASLFWLTGPINMTKVLNGGYPNSGGQDDAFRRVRERLIADGELVE